MKKMCRILTAILLVCVMLNVMPQQAAAAESYNVSGTVGEYLKFVFFDDNQDIVESTEHTGYIPGMKITFPSDGKAALEGTPTQAGTYVLEITVYTQRTSGYNIVLTVTIQEKSSNGIPVITKHPTAEKVVEGESATFIARAENVQRYSWAIAIADGIIDCADLPSYVGKGIQVSGYDTDTLVLTNIPLELDGAYVWCLFVGRDGSVESEGAKITVIAQKDATPEITKHPTDETVEEGGEAVFVAKAKYTQLYLWQLISPDGVIFDCDTVHLSFPDLKITGAKSERITLSNIPLELDGYRIRCMFTAGDTVVSDSAMLTVTAKPTEPPAEEPTETPTELPTETPGFTESQSGNKKTDNKNNKNNKDNSTDVTKPGNTEHPESNTGSSENSSTVLIIVLIISAAAVAVAAIAGFVVLKLSKPGRR